MRFNTFIEKFYVKRMAAKLSAAQWIVGRVQGNWETWSQIETALAAENDASDQLFFEREVRYPQSTKVCDFLVTPANAQDAKIWIELKVMLQTGQGGAEDLAKRYKKDIDKMLEVYESAPGSFSKSSGGPVSFAVSNANVYMEALFEILTIGQNPWCSLIKPDRSVTKFRYDERKSHEIGHGDGVIVYFDIIGKKG